MLRRIFNKVINAASAPNSAPDVLGYFGGRVPQEATRSQKIVVCSLGAAMVSWGLHDHFGDSLTDVKCKEAMKNFDKHYQDQMQFEGR